MGEVAMGEAAMEEAVMDADTMGNASHSVIPWASEGFRAMGLRGGSFFDVRHGRVAGHRFQIVEDEDKLSSDEGRATQRVLRLLRAAVRYGDGLECHLHLAHSDLLYLRTGDLAGALNGIPDPNRIRLAISAVPVSPLPSRLLDSVRRLQSAGWTLALRGVDLGAHGLANLIELEPAVVVLDPALTLGVAPDGRRLRGLVRLARVLSAVGAGVVAGGWNAARILKV